MNKAEGGKRSPAEDQLFPPEDLFFPPGAPPPYITQQQLQQGVNNSDTVISFPEVVVTRPAPAPGACAPAPPEVAGFHFSDKQIRHGFIRKVYGIVLTQLVVTVGVAAWFMSDERLMRAVHGNLPVFLGVSLGTYLVTAVLLTCCEGPRRRAPWNYVFLLLFTLSLAALLGVACAGRPLREVMLAAGITCALVAALTLFACQTKIDFTLMSGSILVLCLVMFFFGMAAVFSGSPALRLAYYALGVLAGGVFLVYDTQLIVGGSHRFAFSPEEYVFAALALYLDIVYIFVRVLRLVR